MLNERPPNVQPTPERRTPLWPWLLMPLAAFALFLALNRVRQLSDVGPVSGPGADVTRDGGG